MMDDDTRDAYCLPMAVDASGRVLRDWLRAHRARLRLDAADLYTSLVGVLVLGSMIAAGLGELTIPLLSASAWWLPAGWLGATALVVGGIARLLGPIGVSAAEAWWMLAAPIDRAEALQPAFTKALVAALVAGLASAAVLYALTGAQPWWPIGCIGACLGAATVALLRQQGHRRRRLGPPAMLGAAWLTGWLTAGSAGLVDPLLAGAMGVGLAYVALGLGVRTAWRGLGSLSRHDLVASGRTRGGLTGAIAGADSGLVYDIVLPRLLASGRARRLAGHGRGARSLAMLDALRLALRSPRVLLGLPASWALLWAATHAGLGTLGGVAVLPGLLLLLSTPLSSFRLVVRSPGLARTFPWRPGALRAAASGAGLLASVVWIAGASLVVEPLLAGILGLTAFAGAVRWLSSGSPDFSTRIVMTETGPVPIGAIGTALRGFDVVAAMAAALLLGVPVVWCAIGAGVLVVLTLVRRPGL